MARLLLNELQWSLLDLLVREGGMSFAALFYRLNAQTGAETPEVLQAAQALYDLSLVDVKVRDLTAPLSAEARFTGTDPWQGPGARYLDNLTPEQLRRAYQHLDAFTVGAVLGRSSAADDPFYFAPSHLAPGEHARPGYAERAAAQQADRAARPPAPSDPAAGSPSGPEELPPPESLPTLPFP
jgi:hypothetical protein